MGRWLIAALETTDNTITLPLAVDWRVVGFAAALAIATCLLFGLAPAIRGTRVSASSVLRASARGATAGRESLALRRGLVVVQIALSVTLLFGSLLFARTLVNVMHVDPGFRADGLVAAEIDSTRLALAPDRRLAHQQGMRERIRAIPGIVGAAEIAALPMSGNSMGNDVWPQADRNRQFNTLANFAGPGYFGVLGVPFVAGRDFDARDVPASSPVIIVNETFAAKLGGAASAVGQRITREATPRRPEAAFEIVGVVKDSNYLTLKEDRSPTMYYAGFQTEIGNDTELMIRSALPPAATTAAITAALANIDPRISISYTVVPTMIRDTTVQERLLAGLSAAFGLLAAVLTVVGLYGLIAYSVTRRATEIGVRMALGATSGNILQLVMRETTTLLAIGVVAGAAAAVAGGQLAASLLFRVKPYDPAALAGAAVILSAVALLAAYLPARRAMRIAPAVALRAE
jgi:predicted permease